jgi:guanine nucleotide-binding protein subunit alpha
MKLIYSQGFSKNEKLEWKPVIFGNIIQSFQTIYDAMNELNIAFENPEHEVRYNRIPVIHLRLCLRATRLSHAGA